jgi:MOSC domain-containing protein YiiM
MGTVTRLWLAAAESEPMAPVESVRAVADRGLEGDRYYRGTGYYSGFDECEVTLVDSAALATIHDETGIDLTDGRHRRNVVTEGVELHDLLDTRFRIGDAVLVGTRPRPPCAHVEDVADEEGVAAALGGDRGGICARVETGGEITVGDEIGVGESVTTDPDELAAAIRERYD